VRHDPESAVALHRGPTAAAAGGQPRDQPQAINDAACLGFCPPAGVIVPRVMDFALQVEPPATTPRRQTAPGRSGLSQRHRRGDLVPIPPFFTMGEAMVNYLNGVGIRVKMRQMERAAFYTAWREKKLRPLFITGVGIRAMPPAGAGVHLLQGDVRLRGATRISTTCSSSRRASATAQARGAPSQDPADHDRPGDVRADHGTSAR